MWNKIIDMWLKQKCAQRNFLSNDVLDSPPSFIWTSFVKKTYAGNKSPTSYKKATTAATATAAAEEFSQAMAPSPTHSGTTYPVRVSPHSDIDMPNGIGAMGCGAHYTKR